MSDIRTHSVKYHTVSADEDTGIVKAIVSVYDIVNDQNSVIRHGAFTESITRRLPMMVNEHDWSKPTGVTLVAKELAAGDALLPEDLKEFGGLYVEGKYFRDITESWETFLKVKNGIYREYSIAFIPTETNVIENGVEEVIKGDLFEWCPVFMGSNDRTATLSTHSLAIGADTKAVYKELERNVARWEHRLEMRLNAGRVLSAETMAELDSTLETLLSAVKRIKSVIDRARPVAKELATEEARARIIMAGVRARTTSHFQETK